MTQTQYNSPLLHLTVCSAVSREILCGCLKDTNTIQESAVTSNGLQCGINRNIVWLFEIHKPRTRPKSITLIKVPEHAAQTPCRCWFNCGYSLEYFLPMSPPHPWSVSVGYQPLGHTETAQFYIRWSVALSNCTVKFRWNFLLSIAVSRTESIALLVGGLPTLQSQTKAFDMPLPKFLR
jgi:hypothetical protein